MSRVKKKRMHAAGKIVLQLKIKFPISNELVLRRSIQDAMEQTFGLTRAYTYFDIVELPLPGDEATIKVANTYVSVYYLLSILILNIIY